MYLSTHTQSIFYTIASGALFGTIGILGVNIFKLGISVHLMSFWRFIIATIILLLYYRKFPKLNYEILKPFTLGALCYAPSTFLWFSSIKLIESSLSMVIFYSFPIYVVIFGFINKEKISKKNLMSIMIMLIGLILIADFKTLKIDLLGIILSMGSAILYGIYFLLSKKLCKDIDSSTSSIMVCLGNAFSFMLINMLCKDDILGISLDIFANITLIAIIGTSLPILFLFKGLKNISGTEAAILSVSEPIISLFIGVTFMGETMNFFQIIAIIFIIFSAIFVQMNKKSA